MSIEVNTWYKLSNKILAVSMRECGFDLTIYDSYPDKVRKVAKRLAINQSIKNLRYAFWKQTETDLNTIKKGVYVIQIAGNMSIQYSLGHSPVIYIGQGNIETRLKNHFNDKLFDFMQSLSGTNFDFYLSQPKKSHYSADDFHKQVEHSMIADFQENFGGINDHHCFPLLNKVSGSNRKIEVDDEWWRKPLKRTGSKTNWILKCGPNSKFVVKM